MQQSAQLIDSGHAAAVRMATAEGIAKLVQKQAGRAKEKVGTTKKEAAAAAKNSPLLTRARASVISSGTVVAVAVAGRVTLD